MLPTKCQKCQIFQRIGQKIHLVLAFLLILLVSADSQQTGCVMRGICGKDGSLRQNCEYNGPPEVLTDSKIQKYQNLCPRLFEDRNNAVCCDEEQFEILEQQISLVEPILGKCSSCFSNFRNLWCQFACMPRQSSHVHVVSTATENAVFNNTPYITRVEYFLTPTFAYGLFDSCKNVQTTNGDFAMSMLCGTSAEDCTAEKLYKNLGTYNRNIGVPFTIDVIITKDEQIRNDSIISPLDAKAYPCNSSSDISSSACSCQDCPSACSSIEPFPSIGKLPFDWKDAVSCERIPGTCKIASMDCTVAMSLLAFGCICVTVMVIAVLHYALRKSTDEDELTHFKPTAPTFKSPEKESDRLHIEEWLIIICSNYGQFVAKRPGFVFFTGLFFALFCSCGLFVIRLTTDPVELWSSPGSEARKQKAFFEENFMPFYRIEQFIVYPKNQAIFLRENVSVLMETGYYGPIYRKEFLEEAFRLQSEVLKLTTTLDGENVSLQEICFKPLKPDNNNCAVMSIFNYFQNDISKLDITMEDDYMVDRDYLDHLMQCVKS
uniref:Niemann-Pick C1 N-terminal domain-containing protein n=1 Tax=Acrobeloides nanus TaxID=290746 RepID=A0A914E6K1_9BILA